MSKHATTVAAVALQGTVLAANHAAAEPITYNFVKVRGLDIFYREAGPKSAPTVASQGR